MVTNAEIIINILMHVLILFTILSLIFWFVISKIEKQSITEEINNNINSYFDSLPDNDKKTIGTFAKDFNVPLSSLRNIYSKPDETTEVNNSWLLSINILYIFIILIIILVLLVTIRFFCEVKDFPILHILKENIVIFLFIGVVEVWFFMNIGSKFVPTKPSLIVNDVKTDLSEKLS